jgi:hypothetical protein
VNVKLLDAGVFFLILREAIKKIPNAIGIIVMQPSFGINREKKDGWKGYYRAFLQIL